MTEGDTVEFDCTGCWPLRRQVNESGGGRWRTRGYACIPSCGTRIESVHEHDDEEEGGVASWCDHDEGRGGSEERRECDRRVNECRCDFEHSEERLRGS